MWRAPSFLTGQRQLIKYATGRNPNKVTDIVQRSKMAVKRKAPYKKSSRKKAKTYQPKKKTYKKKTYKKKSMRKRSKKSTAITLTSGTTRERFVDHRQETKSKASYVTYSSVGHSSRYIRPVAQALLLHYMHRVGDFRTGANSRAQTAYIPEVENPIGAFTDVKDATADEIKATWEAMTFCFRAPNITGAFSSGGLGDYRKNSEHTVLHKAVSTINGNPLSTWKDLEELTTQVADAMHKEFTRGWMLTSVSVTRAAERSDSLGHVILYDAGAGSNIVQFSSVATLKIQNTTPADATASAFDKNNIHRNPLDGYCYEFKNQVPLFKQQYLVNKDQTPREALQLLSNLHYWRTDTSDWHIPGTVPVSGEHPPFPYRGTLSAGWAGGVYTPDLAIETGNFDNEFQLPPKTPSVLFRNYSSKRAARIAPGGIMKDSLREKFVGSVNAFATRYFQVQRPTNDDGKMGFSPVAGYPASYVAGKIPSGGTCRMVGLKPTYRTGDDEDIVLQVENEYIYTARVVKAKLTPMPMKCFVH
tara:strand:- start:1028 stop:2617 length:1590 start_codon:yes stop_codon:yes gene_type:complete